MFGSSDTFDILIVTDKPIIIYKYLQKWGNEMTFHNDNLISVANSAYQRLIGLNRFSWLADHLQRTSWDSNFFSFLTFAQTRTPTYQESRNILFKMCLYVSEIDNTQFK